MRISSVLAILMAAVLLVGCLGNGLPYSNPPADLPDGAVAGTWSVRYASMPWERAPLDVLTINADGTFQQRFRHYVHPDYTYETPWNRWWLERRPDGLVRLHLQGALNFRLGPYPKQYPLPYSDPLSSTTVHMEDELILNVRTDTQGGAVLLQMLDSTEDSYWFPLGDCYCEFKRVTSD